MTAKIGIIEVMYERSRGWCTSTFRNFNKNNRKYESILRYGPFRIKFHEGFN